MTSGRFARILLGLIIVALVAAGTYTYAMIQQRQNSLHAFDRYDVTYTASQAAVELTRLENALLLLERDRTPASLSEVKLRFEILFSKSALLFEGCFLDFAGESPSQQELIRKLQDAVHEIDPDISRAGIDLNVERILDVLRPLEPEIVGLAADAQEFNAEYVAADRVALSRLHVWFSALALGLVICGLGLIGVLTWHNRMLARAHQSLSASAQDLERAAADLSAANEAVAVANEELRSQNQRLIEKEDALRARNVLFNAALNNMSHGLCMFDDDLVPQVYNTQSEKLFDAPPLTELDAVAEADSRPSLHRLAPEHAPALAQNVDRRLAAEFEVECLDGRIIAVVQQPTSDSGWVATFADVSEQRRTMARIAHMARHDGLTNLPNRYAFRERIQEALDDCRTDSSMLAVMCLDLDNFKEVNDTLGHPTGDALLVAAAERLSHCVRETDMVARIGGDEFAVLQPHIERFDDAERLAARLIDEMRRPFLVNGELVHTTSSVGVAISPKHGSDPVSLQKNADLALYAAKSDGRRTYRFFRTEMDERIASRHVLERDLRQAIANGQFEMAYQPIMRLRTMEPTGFEALLRWRHPVRGYVPPSLFIPVAEEAGLITEIGRWVLARACADAARWPSHLKLSVNLSAAQFTQSDIVHDIGAALSRAGLRPERLIVEITESLLLSESIATLGTLHRLKSLGIDVAMDDFGTGYSSLSYLRKYPFDRIKIDRDFVSTVGQGDKSPAIVHTIVQLGAALGMTTVAEGIETQEDLEVLLAAGCPEGQGYLFSEPVSNDLALAFVRGDMPNAVKVA